MYNWSQLIEKNKSNPQIQVVEKFYEDEVDRIVSIPVVCLIKLKIQVMKIKLYYLNFVNKKLHKSQSKPCFICI